MAEYIEREALLKVLRGSAVAKYPASFAMGLFAAADEVSKLPTADVAPVVHGRWERHPQANDIDPVYVCNLCKLNVSNFEMRWMSYCPNCGARMDGE